MRNKIRCSDQRYSEKQEESRSFKHLHWSGVYFM